MALGFAIARVVGNIICMINLVLEHPILPWKLTLPVVKKYGVGHHLYDVQPWHFHHLLSVCSPLLPHIFSIFDNQASW